MMADTIKKHATGLNNGQLSSSSLLKGAKQLKFMGECQLCMVPHGSAKKMFSSGQLCLKNDKKF